MPVLACGLLLAAFGCSAEEARVGSDAEAAPAPVAAPEEATPRFRTPELPVPSISGPELLARLETDDAPVVLDVRTAEEFEAAHVPGAIHIPYDEVANHLDSLETFRERGLVVYCRSGKRAGDAERVLQEAGFERLWDLEGHMLSWQANDLPLAGSCC
jgi:rhodanese-related sulfurtransferase